MITFLQARRRIHDHDVLFRVMWKVTHWRATMVIDIVSPAPMTHDLGFW
jgi:hypothetical protein